MQKAKEILEKLKDIDGFIAVGAFTSQGEMLLNVASSEARIDELGALANDVLLKSQKATDIMGVGRGNMVHIEAPKAHIFARCLNESTDFAATTPGRAHIHMVLILGTEGNIALSKMRLASVIQEIVPFFR